MKNTNLNLARNIVTSFIVDVRKHPEYLETQEWWSVYCHRNFLVGDAMMAIDALKKSL